MQVNNRNSIGFKGLEFSINQYGENGKLLGPLSELPMPYAIPIEEDGYLKTNENPRHIANIIAGKNNTFSSLDWDKQTSLAEHTIAATEIKTAIILSALGVENKLTGKTAEILQELAAKNKEN